MVDIALRFTDKATFKSIHRAIYQQISKKTLKTEDKALFQNLTATGTHWFIDEIGTFYEPTGATEPDGMGGQRPVMQARTGYHVMLRWNGGDAEPPKVISGMEVIWRSDDKDAQGNPVPRPTWWTRIIA